MSVRKAVYEVLNSLEMHTAFYGWELKNWTMTYLDGKQNPYIATVLRALRQYRVDNRYVKCLSKKKSLYMVVGD